MPNVTRGLDNKKNITFLEERFQGHCPYNILHNILGLHLTKHEKCTAAPYGKAPGASMVGTGGR